MKTLLAALLFGAACAPAFAQKPAPENATTAPPRVLKYRFVPQQSSITFELPTTFHVIHGKIDAWRGSVEVDPARPGGLKARIDMRADSIETGKARRDLDFRDRMLDAARFPEIVFDGSSYKGNLAAFEPGGVVTADVSGTLTIHGVAKQIQTNVEAAVLNDHVVVAGAVPVFWKAFGLGDLSRLFVRMKEPMLVVFRLWAVPE
ncbi:MAG TPA: YceI family protein [Thermoanaerobaculia bacterium]|jgi:polyisoprenoid-binding protein YceI|nr:YceI family protein [Thermoanaerobaculia bacterium]